MSADKMYRFEFASYDKLVFTPGIGHLKPGAHKEVIASFLTKDPVNFTKVTTYNI